MDTQPDADTHEPTPEPSPSTDWRGTAEALDAPNAHDAEPAEDTDDLEVFSP